MARQLSSSYLRYSFQLLSTLDPKEPMTGHEAFERASNIIYEWIKMKSSAIYPDIPYFKTSLDLKRDGNETSLIYEPENERFIFRLSHVDSAIAGRVWVTDIQLCRQEDEYVFAVRLSVSALKTCTEEVPYSCPECVRRIVRQIGLRSGVDPITGTPHYLQTEAEVDAFVDYLQDRRRHLPALLLSPSYYPEEELWAGYTVDPDHMGRELLGVGNVYCLSEEMVPYLCDQVDRWGVYNGAIRTFYPDLYLEDEDYYRHPRLLADEIHKRCTPEEADKVTLEVEGYIQRYVLRRPLPWADRQVEFYLAAHQNLLRKQWMEASNANQETLDFFEQELNQKETELKEAMELAESYSNDVDALQSALQENQAAIARLKARIMALEASLNASSSAGDTEVPLDGGFQDMADWVDSYYPDRLLLHSRAKRSLKKAQYEDVKLIYACLKLLATSYYDYRTTGKSFQEFIQDCRAVDPGLDLAGAVTKTAAGMYGEDYKIQYGGKSRTFEWHLGKGTNKDPKKTLRIYFIWDDENKLVVIGDLPAHLDNSLS